MRFSPSLSHTWRSIMPHMRSTMRANVIQAAPMAQASVGDGSAGMDRLANISASSI